MQTLWTFSVTAYMHLHLFSRPQNSSNTKKTFSFLLFLSHRGMRFDLLNATNPIARASCTNS